MPIMCGLLMIKLYQGAEANDAAFQDNITV